jgi:hypothetical protein
MSQVQQRLMPELKKGESQKKRTVLALVAFIFMNLGRCMSAQGILRALTSISVHIFIDHG